MRCAFQIHVSAVVRNADPTRRIRVTHFDGRTDLMDADPEQPSIRGEYERLGAAAYYRLHGRSYRNPHEPVIDRVLRESVALWRPDLARVLDLAAGSGEVTLVLRKLGAGTIDGVDPFTHAAYERRVGQPAERFSFEDVAAGAFAGRRYTLIVCSFAMHLLQESRLPLLAKKLAQIAPRIWIVTPHKRPRIDPSWGWELTNERVVERVRIRDYRSAMIEEPVKPAPAEEPPP
jgi:SAM-dependent methyltransferase